MSPDHIPVVPSPSAASDAASDGASLAQIEVIDERIDEPSSWGLGQPV